MSKSLSVRMAYVREWHVFRKMKRSIVNDYKRHVQLAGLHHLPLQYRWEHFGGRGYLEVTCDGGFPDSATYEVLREIMNRVWSPYFGSCVGGNN
jgi:hypothetical protein